MFTKNAEGEAHLEDPKIMFRDRHVHTFRVEPGSRAEGKTLGDLEFSNRFGIANVGIRSEGRTSRRIDPTRTLLAGEVLITFITDQTAQELAPLFAKKKIRDGEYPQEDTGT